MQIKQHYTTKYHVDTGLFTVATRSETVQELYEAAAKTPVATIAEMDRIMGNIAGNSTEAFICTPVLSRQRRNARTNNVDLDIEVSLVCITLPNAHSQLFSHYTAVYVRNCSAFLRRSLLVCARVMRAGIRVMSGDPFSVDHKARIYLRRFPLDHSCRIWEVFLVPAQPDSHLPFSPLPP